MEALVTQSEKNPDAAPKRKNGRKEERKRSVRMLYRKKSFANETEANKIFNDAAPNSKRMFQLAGHACR